jgi:hypothetical protein
MKLRNVAVPTKNYLLIGVFFSDNKQLFLIVCEVILCMLHMRKPRVYLLFVLGTGCIRVTIISFKLTIAKFIMTILLTPKCLVCCAGKQNQSLTEIG